MTAQYGRKCSLIVGNQSGQGIELSDLRVKFSIFKADNQSPAHANIRVYNLSDGTAQEIQQEYTHMFLQAGYEGNFGLLFSGNVRQFRRGRENATDTYFDILAQDGDEGYNFAVANTSIAAGWAQDDLHERLVQSLSVFGITEGYKPEFGGPKMPRGKVCYGMTRDYLRNLADSAGTSWHIADNLLNMVPTYGTLPGAVVVLNAASGVIGLPQQTINGVTVKCLINPQIKYGGQVQLDNASIQQQSFNVAYQPGASNHGFQQNGLGNGVVSNVSLDNDGFYKVYAIDITGDTRGQDWYMELICVAVNGTTPLQGPYINATASSTGF